MSKLRAVWERVEVIGRPESLMTDLLPPDSAADFAQLPHWTTLARRDGADQGAGPVGPVGPAQGAYFKIFERGRTFNDEYFFVRMYLNRFGVSCLDL
eukprot:Skav203110  [mRNA]  locus=scaffold447:421041:425173:+ [translate_table: standard]